MSESSPEQTLAEIKRLLDDGAWFDRAEEMTLEARVADVIEGMNGWADLAIKRLHEIHRLEHTECEFCAKYLDGP